MKPPRSFKHPGTASSGHDHGERVVRTETQAAESATPEAPWHFAVTDAIEQLRERDPAPTAEDMNQAAGLAWSVYQTSAYLFTGHSATLPLDCHGYVSEPQPGHAFKLVATPRRSGSLVPTFTLNVRDDLHQVVGVVRGRYRLSQNHELPRVLEHLVDRHDAQWEAAGLLRAGAEVWWLVRMQETVSVGEDARETIEFYLLLTHCHDGATKTNAAVLPLRIRSQTTLAWQLARTPRAAVLKRTESMPQRAIAAEGLLELVHAYMREFAHAAEELLNCPLTDAEFARFLERLLPTPMPEVKSHRIVNQRGITMAENTKGTITQIYFNNPGQAHLQRTLWGAIQACQFYSDHLTINRNTDDSTANENRFKRLTSGETLGARAFTQALKHISHDRHRKP